MEMNQEQIKKLIHQTLSEKLRIGTGIDFHSLHEGYPLILAGVTIPHERGFHVKRSDGDPVSHAVVDALLAAVGEGDITDWFSDQDNITNAHSIDYLGELYKKLLEPQRITIISVQVIILAEQPRLKPFFPHMQREIASQLAIKPQQVKMQGETYEGKGMIGQNQGIEARAKIILLAE
jgi:2-C-methyl-D-erythritol 2,4-cyclodiphosphate synthase